MRSISRILIAGCLTSLSLVPTAYAEGERLLTGEELQLLFPGLIAHFDQGVKTKEFKYFSDGKMTRHKIFSKQGVSADGKWRVEDNKMCFRLVLWREGKPDICNHYGLEGVTDEVKEIDFGAIKGKKLLVLREDGSIKNRANVKDKKN